MTAAELSLTNLALPIERKKLIYLPYNRFNTKILNLWCGSLPAAAPRRSTYLLIWLFPSGWWYNYSCTANQKGLVIKDIGAGPTEEVAADPASVRSEAFAHDDGKLVSYWGEVCAYIRRRFGEGPPDPEEVVQNAFVKILAKPEIDKIENPRAFLYTTVYNTAIDMIRSQNRVSRFKSSVEGDVWANVDELTPERVLVSQENFQMALDAIKDMPDLERETLILYRIHGLTLVEIAERLGKSKTSIIRYLANAMRGLVETARMFEHVE